MTAIVVIVVLCIVIGAAALVVKFESNVPEPEPEPEPEPGPGPEPEPGPPGSQSLCGSVPCPPASSDCKVAGTCQETDGSCSPETDAQNGKPCDDGDPKTINDMCTDGACTGEPAEPEPDPTHQLSSLASLAVVGADGLDPPFDREQTDYTVIINKPVTIQVTVDTPATTTIVCYDDEGGSQQSLEDGVASDDLFGDQISVIVQEGKRDSRTYRITVFSTAATYIVAEDMDAGQDTFQAMLQDMYTELGMDKGEVDVDALFPGKGDQVQITFDPDSGARIVFNADAQDEDSSFCSSKDCCVTVDKAQATNLPQAQAFNFCMQQDAEQADMYKATMRLSPWQFWNKNCGRAGNTSKAFTEKTYCDFPYELLLDATLVTENTGELVLSRRWTIQNYDKKGAGLEKTVSSLDTMTLKVGG
jgi:hypothetical protein